MFSRIRKAPSLCYNCDSASLPEQNLALSPREIMELTARGVAASASNSGLTFSEGSPNPSLLLENTRGVDPADLWTASQDAAEKLTVVYKKNKSS